MSCCRTGETKNSIGLKGGVKKNHLLKSPGHARESASAKQLREIPLTIVPPQPFRYKPPRMAPPQGNTLLPQGNPLRRWIADNPFLIAGAVYLLGNGIQLLFARAASSEWEQVFVYSANVLIHGGDLYAPGINQFQLNHPFTYPPFHALLAIPFTILPHFLSRLGWFIVQILALTVLWKLSWIISGGRPLNRGRWTNTEAAIWILGLLAGIRYIQGAFGHQQSDILIDAFLVAGCYAWQYRRDFLAATAWAVAAAFKGPPLIMAVYLAWRGRWLAAAWMIVLAIGLNLVPDAIDLRSARHLAHTVVHPHRQTHEQPDRRVVRRCHHQPIHRRRGPPILHHGLATGQPSTDRHPQP